MNTELVDIAKKLVADDKGLLAMDESNPTCNKRFAKLGIAQTEETRRAYRDLLITAPGLSASISGVILYDETIRQRTKDGASFVDAAQRAGMIAGIKVDLGAKALAGHPQEKVTEGLDGLRERLHAYWSMGARFAKWRAVLTIGPGIPSHACIESNAHALARYATLCQEAGLVPLVEPEIIMEGDHSMQRCSEVTEQVLRAVFHQLYEQGAALDAVILKPNMVLPGSASSDTPSDEEVAEATLSCLRRSVPAAIAAIAFLSGGQSGKQASARLNAMHVHAGERLPWPLTFSFARAIQQHALEIWRGDEIRASAAQRALVHRAACDRAARRGEYNATLEGKV